MSDLVPFQLTIRRIRLFQSRACHLHFHERQHITDQEHWPIVTDDPALWHWRTHSSRPKDMKQLEHVNSCSTASFKASLRASRGSVWSFLLNVNRSAFTWALNFIAESRRHCACPKFISLLRFSLKIFICQFESSNSVRALMQLAFDTQPSSKTVNSFTKCFLQLS